MRVSDGTVPAGGNGRAIALLGAALLVASALSLHALTRLKDAAVALAAAREAIGPGRLLAALGPLDAVLAVALVALAALLVAAEWRQGAFSRLLRTATPTEAFVVLTLVVAFLGHSYFFPGVLLGADTGTHVLRTLELRRGLEQGIIADWTNYQYLGSPLLGFTGPLFYLLTGSIDLIVRDPMLTLKLVLFVCHVLSGWLVYAFLRRLDLGAVAAMIGAIVYAGAFTHFHLFLARGLLPQSVTIVFMLLLFVTAEGIMRRGARHFSLDWAGFALGTGGLIANHQPHAVFVAAYLGLYGAVSLALGRWRFANLVPIVTAGACGVAMAIAAVLPILFESSWVMIVPESGFFRVQLPSVERLSHLLVWRNTRTTWGYDYWAYLGIVALGLAAFGLWAALAGRLAAARRGIALAFLPCLVLSFFLYNPVVRDVMFMLLFVAVYAALGMERLLSGRGGAAASVVTLLLMLDFTSTAIQPVARSDKGFMVDAGRYLERSAPQQRVVEIGIALDGTLTASMGPDGTPMSYYATVQRVAGHHNMAATHVHNYVATVVKMVERDLRRQRRLAPETEQLLALLNVGHVVCFASFRAGCPEGVEGAVEEGPLGRTIPIAGPTPVVFARSLVALAPEAGLDKPMLWVEDFEQTSLSPKPDAVERFLRAFLAAEAPNPGAAGARALAVRTIPAGAAAPATSDAAWNPVLRAYNVGLDRVTATIEADRPGYVQLSHPWYPGNEIRVNGAPAQAIEGALSMIVLPVGAGTSVIEISHPPTPVRAASAWVSCLTLLLVLAATGVAGLRRRSWQPPSAPPREADTPA